MTDARSAKSQAEVEAWLIGQVAERLGIDPRRIDARHPLARYGLDSIVAVELTEAAEQWLGHPISETVMWDEPTIEAIARQLAEEPESADEPVAMAEAPASKPAETVPDSEAREHSPVPVPSPMASSEPIAIIGMGCRLPGAEDAEAFWDLLRSGGDAVREVPDDRWDGMALYDADPTAAGKMTSRWGGFLDGIDQFDADFFGISPREATHMDPQQRLLMEVAWETLENAGIAPKQLAGEPVGVFVGVSTSDYVSMYLDAPELIDAYTNTGNAHSVAASRLSYLLDLRGPSLAIDTACSSSLVALHLACQSLRSGESTMALVGGVNAMLSPSPTIGFSKARMMSTDGHCKSFDAEADGLVRGEGCGLVLLRPLSAALEAGDRVLAVIRGSAVNQDGRSSGLTAPSGAAQAEVIRRALRQAGVAPTEIGYVVGQGTGTSLGDAIEVQALAEVMSDGDVPNVPCALGSVKANIGHLEAAAGIASLIAAVQALRHQEIPSQLHFHTPNPSLGDAAERLQVPMRKQKWAANKKRTRYAAVSAFSISGTNAHVVLAESPPPPQTSSAKDRPLHLLALSAQSEGALRTLADRYVRLLGTTKDALPDIAYTANVGREHFSHRLAVVGESRLAMRDSLRRVAEGSADKRILYGPVKREHAPRVALSYGGESCERRQFDFSLYQTQPSFRAAFDACDVVLADVLEHPLRAVIDPRQNLTARLSQSLYAHAALFAWQYALTALWRSWGILPDAAVGSGVGAYVAATVSGILGLEAALGLVTDRAELLQRIGQAGVALEVAASEAQIAEIIEPFHEKVAVVASLAGERTVLAGHADTMALVREALQKQSLETAPAPTSYGLHAPLIDPLIDAYALTVSKIRCGAASVPTHFVLDDTTHQSEHLLDAAFWRCHNYDASQAPEAVRALSQDGIQFCIELDPTGSSARLLKSSVAASDVTLLTCAGRDPRMGAWTRLLGTLATLYVNGVAVDWHAFDRGFGRARVTTPTYPFQRERHWIAPPIQQRQDPVVPVTTAHPLLGQRVTV